MAQERLLAAGPGDVRLQAGLRRQDLSPGLPGGSHPVALRRRPGKRVEDGQMGLGIHQAVGVELAMNLDQPVAQLAQQADPDRGIVDVGAASPFGADRPSEHEQIILARDVPLAQQRQRRVVGAEIEGRRDMQGRCAVADQPCVPARAQREPERIQQDRLARPGLAGQCRQARCEPQGQPVDQDDVTDRKVDQHDQGLRRFQGGRKGGGPPIARSHSRFRGGW